LLVLSRKLGEKIFIGPDICITVVDIDRGKIRLGLEAPKDGKIYRQELLPTLTPLVVPPIAGPSMKPMEAP
jgi:carbon storage regulator